MKYVDCKNKRDGCEMCAYAFYKEERLTKQVCLTFSRGHKIGSFEAGDLMFPLK